MYSRLQRVLFRDEDENYDCESTSSNSDPMMKEVSGDHNMSPLSSPCAWRDDKHLDTSSEKCTQTDDVCDDDYNSDEKCASLLLCHQLEKLKETISPGYVKKVRELRLFGSPQTPKTLLRRAEMNSIEAAAFDVIKTAKSRTLFKENAQTPILDTSFLSQRFKGQKRRNSCSPRSVNINPFTPTGMMLQQRRQKRQKTSSLDGSFLNHNSSIESGARDLFDETDESETEFEPIQWNGQVYENNSTSRYNADFVEICEIGKGEHGSVYKCVHRLDGCQYALKRTRKPFHGTQSAKRALNEVYAHAVLGKHSRVVQYYSAWAENDHMYIQNEYCDGGSLSTLIADLKAKGQKFTEAQLKKVLLHVAQGLKYIHSQNLVHLDIKPANIFISRNHKSSLYDLNDRLMCSSEDGFDDCISVDDDNDDDVIYKIGDLGLVTSVLYPQVEEGDCRYLPYEILHEDYSHLPKADIFSLGLTIFEMASGEELTKNGEKWHDIRNGKIPKLPNLSEEFYNLIKKMIHKDPVKRPSSSAIVKHPLLLSDFDKSTAQLRKELKMANLFIKRLSQRLEEGGSSPDSNNTLSDKKRTLHLYSRSKSVTLF
ncbi:wee1-like protein kinase 2 [Dinothrombium tinctorium]|uniref:Wee1-like protein kinase n=1 Tax=Dinothrombium tinctorium TaxID=1965070 RepID=A0A3S3QHZ2_9ACAR|nr:wee1-like protein kinase 2 [Dinothrombium tinctorium]